MLWLRLSKNPSRIPTRQQMALIDNEDPAGSTVRPSRWLQHQGGDGRVPTLSIIKNPGASWRIREFP